MKCSIGRTADVGGAGPRVRRRHGGAGPTRRGNRKHITGARGTQEAADRPHERDESAASEAERFATVKAVTARKPTGFKRGRKRLHSAKQSTDYSIADPQYHPQLVPIYGWHGIMRRVSYSNMRQRIGLCTPVPTCNRDSYRVNFDRLGIIKSSDRVSGIRIN